MAFLAIATGIILIYLAIEGPLFLHQIRYKTAGIINNQIIGQDIINLFVLSPVLITGGVTLFLKRRISPYLIYFVLSYTIGCEWSSDRYQGNSDIGIIASDAALFPFDISQKG